MILANVDFDILSGEGRRVSENRAPAEEARRPQCKQRTNGNIQVKKTVRSKCKNEVAE